MNDAPGLPEILSHFVADPLWIVLLVGAGVWYGVTLRRADRTPRKSRQPRWKVAAFYAGLVVLAVGTLSPIEHYGNDLLWIDFIGFLLITMIGAPLVVLGSPLTLAFRAATPEGAKRLRAFYRSAPMRWLTFPITSGLLFASVTYLWQFSGLTDTATQNIFVREIQELSLLFVSLLFWTPALCTDPVRWRIPYPLRVLYVFVEMTHKALFGAMLLALDRPVHTAMAARLPAWAPSGLDDQRLGIVILWMGGNVIFFGTVVGIIVRWMQYEGRHTARVDRQLAIERASAKRRAAALEQVFRKPV
jgi:putative copper resistance protein D